jgi:hypothetical protein
MNILYFLNYLFLINGVIIDSLKFNHILIKNKIHFSFLFYINGFKLSN